MGFLDVLGKVGQFVISPIKTICDIVNDYAHEPLKKWEHERSEQSKDNDVRRQIDIDTARIRTESNLRMQEAEQNISLEIKRATEIVRITREIEEWQKDKQFERMKQVTEAIMIYQEKLTSLNINAIAAIGNMELSLRQKAHELIIDKTQKYEELQQIAIKRCGENLMRIEKNFPDNERAKDMLYLAANTSLTSIINAASNFIVELNYDIKMLNSNIDLLTKSGQKFIESHLQQFDTLSPNEAIKRVEDPNIGLISRE
ncbi:MAG: hypothetical protein LBQ22_00545 [Bacteroidales bacterium]|jgi:hypothetical protein|nr:hypothetical protein [Bacteroidales bacterium]